MSETEARTLVVATAGHIDHGKTSLLRALTGVDLDRTPEERQRGITLHLGFVEAELDAGHRVAWVDVPGHEGLVRTMVAGASGVDAALLVVSAAEGVMPQTREHLQILDLLGLDQGVVCLTKIDLVDEELLELAAAEVAELIEGTKLAHAPLLPVSALDGRGLEALRRALVALKPRPRHTDGPFRLPVDRAFSRPGFGTVVTGTVASGVLHGDQMVRLLPADRPVRVRGLQRHGHPTDRLSAGQRGALNLAGVEVSEVPRGTVAVAGGVPLTSVFDALIRLVPSQAPVRDGDSVRVLTGTSEALGRIYAAMELDSWPLGVDLPVQLRLERPLVVLPGDRLILRRPSPAVTLGGGQVVDPWARPLRSRYRHPAGEQIRRLAAGQTQVWLERAGLKGLTQAEWLSRGGEPSQGVQLGERRFDPAALARLEGELLQAATEYHLGHPLALGASPRELHRGLLLELDAATFDALVQRLAGQGQLVLDGPTVRAGGFQVRLDARAQALLQALTTTVSGTGLEGIAPKELHQRHPEPEVSDLMRLLESRGVVESVPSLGWAARTHLNSLRQQITDWFTTHPTLEPSDFKELTKLTRKAAIPLLEWLDKKRLTRREGTTRLPGGLLNR